MDYSDPKKYSKKTKRYYKSKARKTKNKVSVTILRLALIMFVALIFGAGGILAGAYVSITGRAPVMDWQAIIDDDKNYSTVIINEKTGEKVDQLDGGENREYVSSEQIPLNMKNAIIAIEDERFYSHNGVDFKGIIRMFYVALTTSRTEGASTITQQVIKNMLGYKQNTIETKLQEQVLAVQFEETLTEKLGSKERAKDYILTTYMNAISLGHGQIGVQAAALYYFNKNVWELEISECAVIAAITSNPSARSPVRKPEGNRQRQLIVLENMLRLSMITQEEYDEAVADDVYSRIQEVGQLAQSQPSFHSYFNDYVISVVAAELQKKYNLTREDAFNWVYSRGLKIYTTEDPVIQEIVDRVYLDENNFPKTEFEIEVTYSVNIKNSLTGLSKNYEKKFTVKNWEDIQPYIDGINDKLLKDGDEIVANNTHTYAVVQPQSAFIVIDYHTGHIVAMAGSRGEKLTNRGLNRATDSKRQPGSTFKVLTSYAPAMDMGYITAATVLDDVPYYIEGANGNLKEWPDNWYKDGYRGLNSVRTAIVDSMNVLAVKNLADLGLTNSFNYLNNFGFTTLVQDSKLDRNDNNLSLGLGGITYGVTQIELAAAYGTIANQGYYNKPVCYTKVLDHNDNVLLENNLEPVEVLKKTTAYILTDIMEDVMTTGTGAPARFSSPVNMPIAGKTGTTSDVKDLVFAGYTPYYVATVWLGYDQPKNLNSKTRNDKIHLNLWKTIMEEIHRDLPYKDFDKPNGIVEVKICKDSGKLVAAGLCDNDPRGSRVKTEIFEEGTEPTTYCDVHREYKVCVASYKAPSSYCPADYIAALIGIVRPQPYYGSYYVRDKQYEVPSAVLRGEVCTEHGFYSGAQEQPQQGQNDEGTGNENDTPERTPIPIWNIIPTPAPTATPPPLYMPSGTEAPTDGGPLIPAATPTPTPYLPYVTPPPPVSTP